MVPRFFGHAESDSEAKQILTLKEQLEQSNLLSKPIFKINNLQYKHKNEMLVNIKNFEFHRGACYMISGEMGSGKTTILDIMNKKLKQSSGSVLYENSKLDSISLSNYLQEVNYVAQKTRKPFFCIRN